MQGSKSYSAAPSLRREPALRVTSAQRYPTYRPGDARQQPLREARQQNPDEYKPYKQPPLDTNQFEVEADRNQDEQGYTEPSNESPRDLQQELPGHYLVRRNHAEASD